MPAGPRTPTLSPLVSQICDELPSNIAKLYWHVPRLVWNARVPSGDLLSHGAWQLHGARVELIRGILQLFGATQLAWHLVPRLRLHLRRLSHVKTVQL